MDPSRTLSDVFAAAVVSRGTLHGRDVLLDLGDPVAECEAFASGAALADVSDRTQVELAGADRASFLHNLCTNEIRRLSPGAGCEAFLLDALGRVLGHVFVFVGDSSIILDTVPGQGQALVAHLDRYLIREKVELSDRSDVWREFLLAGPKAAAVLGAAGLPEPPDAYVSCIVTQLSGHDVMIRRAPLAHPSAILIAGIPEVLAEVAQTLHSAGAMPVGQTAVEAARVAAGSPWYGVDITAKTLPQEVARDDRAISFTKGCYIGQETVARLDARGHVNKTLGGVLIVGAEVPLQGTALVKDDAEVGQVTSAAYVPRLGGVLALAYLRTTSSQQGTSLTCAGRSGRVVSLPA